MLIAMFPRMIEPNFEPAGYARKILKDLEMLHNLAKIMSGSSPVCHQTASLFRILNSTGHEGDWTASPS